MYIIQFLTKKVKDIIRLKYNIENCEFSITKPPEDVDFDYAINVSFVLSKILKKEPASIADEIANELKKDEKISKIKVEKGYINILLDNDFLKYEIFNLINNKNYFRTNTGENKKVNIEFVSANPVGPLNVVNGRAAAFGDTLANLLYYSGYNVHKEYYINDFGRQVKLFAKSIEERYYELHKLKEKAEIPEDGYKGEYLIDIAKQIDIDRENTLEEVKAALELNQLHDIEDFFKSYGINYVINWQKTTLENFGVIFDEWFSEKSLYEKKEVENILQVLKEKNLLIEKDGALWFDSKIFGDDKKRVVKKADGEYTYFAGDIAYMNNKFKRGFDIVINILGPDHHGYLKRMEATVKALDYNEKNFKIIILQQVNLLYKGEKLKMSKREGKLVLLDELIETVGRDAARYYFIMRNPNSHLDFDIELAKEQSDKNPVYYVQYAYARICNIFNFATEKHIFIEDYDLQEIDFSNIEKEERKIITYLLDLPFYINDAAQKFSPSFFVQKFYDMVSIFHFFYNKFRVISDDKIATLKRLFIMKAFKISLYNCFKIIGITPKENM